MSSMNALAAIKQFFFAHKVTAVIVVLILIGIGYWYYRSTRPVERQFITVTRGPITETVSVTGNTSPMESVALGFRNSGTIAHVYYRVGDQVSAGSIIADLNTASLLAALQQAQAAYDSAVASRSAASVQETATEARNAYLSAYTTLDTNLHDSVDTLFGGPTAYGPQLLITAPMYSYGELSQDRDSIKNELNGYRQSLSRIYTSEPLDLLTDATAKTQDVANFLTKLSVAVNDTTSGATTAQRTALSTARSSVDALLKTLSTARDSYRSGNANATAIADASVEQAAAGIAVARANLDGAKIVAPISGVITTQDAKVGQIASAGTALVSIITAHAYEVEAGIPESDIGKVAIGNKTTMTLDAFPGETFTGTVFYIDPAQTVTGGVIDYKIKVSFDAPDARMKSGLTTNLDIATRQKDSVLLLPQYAILQNDEGTFVRIVQGAGTKDVPVTLGMQDKSGNTEVVSGVTEGEQVLNIGLKQ